MIKKYLLQRQAEAFILYSLPSSFCAFVILLMTFLTGPVGAEEILLNKKGSLYSAKVTLNEVMDLDFIIDTASADVSVPQDVFLVLLRSGTVKKTDVLPDNLLRLPDGRAKKVKSFIIRKVRVGSTEVLNVRASVDDSLNSPLLLGQSFLSRLGTWGFDLPRNRLVVGTRFARTTRRSDVGQFPSLDTLSSTSGVDVTDPRLSTPGDSSLAIPRSVPASSSISTIPRSVPGSSSISTTPTLWPARNLNNAVGRSVPDSSSISNAFPTSLPVTRLSNVPPASSPPGGNSQGNPATNVDFGPYMENLRRRVRQSWIPPQAGNSQRTVVEFSLDRLGGLLAVKVARASGSSAQDNAALDALRRAAPFGPLPTGYQGDHIDVRFTFDVNVQGGGGSVPF